MRERGMKLKSGTERSDENIEQRKQRLNLRKTELGCFVPSLVPSLHFSSIICHSLCVSNDSFFVIWGCLCVVLIHLTPSASLITASSLYKEPQ
ncbi:hypothetical protein VNO77_16321 [Canavalia gladiata]|uniref:Uncharacterized protein n=1 Tax=Canavalia gladiata TaxID=3824 RepID=A0AAN9QT00_CANGL